MHRYIKYMWISKRLMSWNTYRHETAYNELVTNYAQELAWKRKKQNNDFYKNSKGLAQVKLIGKGRKYWRLSHSREGFTLAEIVRTADDHVFKNPQYYHTDHREVVLDNLFRQEVK